jgi:hypothetical protein
MLGRKIITADRDEPQNLCPSNESLTAYYGRRTRQMHSWDTGTVKQSRIRYILNPNSIHRREAHTVIGWLQLHAIWCPGGGIIRAYWKVPRPIYRPSSFFVASYIHVYVFRCSGRRLWFALPLRQRNTEVEYIYSQDAESLPVNNMFEIHPQK